VVGVEGVTSFTPMVWLWTETLIPAVSFDCNHLLLKSPYQHLISRHISHGGDYPNLFLHDYTPWISLGISEKTDLAQPWHMMMDTITEDFYSTLAI